MTTLDINFAVEIGTACRSQLYGFDRVNWMDLFLRYWLHESKTSLACDGYVCNLTCS